MTAIEHKELKGITVKNLVVTIFSTASIVASVITTYCNLKTDIREVKLSQETETRINNIRIKVLEDQVFMLQKQLAGMKCSDILWPMESPAATSNSPLNVYVASARSNKIGEIATKISATKRSVFMNALENKTQRE